jgi:polyisoprenoid-binding protein YceI
MDAPVTTYPDVRTDTYRIDPSRSRISFVVRTRLGLFGVSGTFALRSGEVEIAASPTASTVHAVVDAGSFRSGIARRDRDVRSKHILDVANMPDIVFSGHGSADGATVLGQLSRGDHRVATTLQVTGAESTEDGYRVTAVSCVDRQSLGVTQPRPWRFLDLVLEVHLTTT